MPAQADKKGDRYPRRRIPAKDIASSALASIEPNRPHREPSRRTVRRPRNTDKDSIVGVSSQKERFRVVEPAKGGALLSYDTFPGPWEDEVAYARMVLEVASSLKKPEGELERVSLFVSSARKRPS